MNRDILTKEFTSRLLFYKQQFSCFINEDNILPKVIDAVVHSLSIGGTIFCAGNGGSMADSLHFTAELVGRFETERRSLPAVSLGANLSSLTAIANDYDYSLSFSRELNALATGKDVVLLLSTSGNSQNIVSTAETALSIGCQVYGFTGSKPSRLSQQIPCVQVASTRTALVQEMHGILLHIICSAIDAI